MGFNYQNGDPIPDTVWNAFLSSAGLYGASAEGSDAYEITVAPVPNDYDAGDTYTFKADVGNTGAATLEVNGLGPKTIKKFGTQDLSTGDIIAGQIVTVKYDGTYFQIASEVRPVPFFQQQVNLQGVSYDTQNDFATGSNQDGSVFYLAVGGSDDRLARFQRDTLTGMYVRTHEVSLTAQISNSQGLVQVGDYIYLFYSSGGNAACKRFLAADLTGETAMTMPASLSTTDTTAWTDGTYVYIVLDGSATTSRKWSISGTTFSAVSTATVSGIDGTNHCSFWDGNYAYIVYGTNETFTIRKLTTIDGTTYSDTTKTLPKPEGNEGVYVAMNIDATKIYIGGLYDTNNASTLVARVVHLYPISKP